MKQIPHKCREVNSKFRALTSLIQEQYEIIEPVFHDLMESKILVTTLKGYPRIVKEYKEKKNSSLYGSRSKLDFILTYLKENPNQSRQALLFDMTQSKVSEWVSFILPVLFHVLEKLKVMPCTGNTFTLKNSNNVKHLIIDVVERDIPRKEDYEAQKEEYSGKKKKHTLKNLAITDQNGSILFSSESYVGKTHDKTILDEISINTPHLYILADLGFQGMDSNYENAILPFKKPKNGELTDDQKTMNKFISQLRIRIEHAFSGVKRLKSIRNKIRLRGFNIRHMVIMIGMGLHNLRLQYYPLVNQS